MTSVKWAWMNKNIIRRDDIPAFVIPKRRSSSIFSGASLGSSSTTSGVHGDSRKSSTNTDPLSISAMGLCHLKIVTDYGFETLKELPNTKRKESLLAGCLTQRHQTRCLGDEMWTLATSNNDLSYTCAQSGGRAVHGNRRRSSLPYLHHLPLPEEEVAAYGQYQPPSECTYTHDRRRSSSLEDIRVIAGDEEVRWRSHTVVGTKASDAGDQGFLTNRAPNGEVKFSVSYDREQETLNILLIRAQGLPSRGTGKHHIYAKVSLQPNDSPKQRSQLIKYRNDAAFFEQFPFADIPENEVKSLTVSISLFRKTHRLRSDDFLGEARLSLNQFNTDNELRLWRRLHMEYANERLGNLEVTLKLSADYRLEVTVQQAQDLRGRNAKPVSNSCVRLELTQPGQVTRICKTRTIRNTPNPCYRQTFSFDLSHESINLYLTRLTLSVRAVKVIGSEPAIGCVSFCSVLSKDQANHHWNQVLEQPGCEITQWHCLVPLDT